MKQTFFNQFSPTINEEEIDKFGTISRKKKPPIFITKTSKNINRRINMIKELIYIQRIYQFINSKFDR